MWKHYHECEKVYLSTQNSDKNLKDRRDKFRSAQNAFSKAIKKARRAFQRKQVYNLEECNTKDPVEFGNCIARMGPKRRSGILWEIVGDNNECITDKQHVLNKWKDDFKGLLTPPETNDAEAKKFEEHIHRENEDLINNSPTNEEINIAFTYDEVRKIVNHAKKGKAPGIGGLTSDILKNTPSVELLT